MTTITLRCGVIVDEGMAWKWKVMYKKRGKRDTLRISRNMTQSVSTPRFPDLSPLPGGD